MLASLSGCEEFPLPIGRGKEAELAVMAGPNSAGTTDFVGVAHLVRMTYRHGQWKNSQALRMTEGR